MRAEPDYSGDIISAARALIAALVRGKLAAHPPAVYQALKVAAMAIDTILIADNPDVPDIPYLPDEPPF